MGNDSDNIITFLSEYFDDIDENTEIETIIKKIKGEKNILDNSINKISDINNEIKSDLDSLMENIKEMEKTLIPESSQTIETIIEEENINKKNINLLKNEFNKYVDNSRIKLSKMVNLKNKFVELIRENQILIKEKKFISSLSDTCLSKLKELNK